MDLGLKGKRALVCGASKGLGFACADALAAEGVDVVIVARGAEALLAAAERIRGAHGVRVEAVATDITTREGRAEALLACERLGGSPDILVNNAGMIARGPLTEATDTDIATSLSVNVEAPLRLCRAAIPIMAAKGGGAIVNTASCWGLRPGPNHPIYVMTKAAVASLTQCLGRDHAHQNIRVNAVCPNEVDTPMLRSGFQARGLDPEKAIDDLNASVPLGRIAEPQDITDVITFLASDAARYMCGSLVEVNGGKPVV